MDGLYFRVSSDRQTTENQFEDLLAVAEKDDSARDWTSIRDLLSRCIVEEEVRGEGARRTVYRVNPDVADRLADLCIYVEQGRSGRRGARSRRMFERMKKDAALRKFDRLLVWKVSRLGRDMREVISTVYELADAGVTVVPIKSQTGPTNSTMGKLLWAIQAWFAEMENEERADGSTLDVADQAANRAAFGYPGASRGASAFPQLRFVSLLENGTHVLFGSRMGPCTRGEITLAKQVLPALEKGLLCLADRNLLGYPLWRQARETGAQLLWRAKKHLRLDVLERFDDGSYRSAIYASEAARRKRRQPLPVRVIEYQLEAIDAAEEFYRLVTTILDPAPAPAEELAALYCERWEIEGALDELKTHLRGARIVLRSKTPELVQQEFYGLLLAPFAIRGLLHEAAVRADEDPDRLSYLHAVRVVRRKLARAVAIPPSGQESVS